MLMMVFLLLLLNLLEIVPLRIQDCLFFRKVNEKLMPVVSGNVLMTVFKTKDGDLGRNKLTFQARRKYP